VKHLITGADKSSWEQEMTGQGIGDINPAKEKAAQ
jgi:hypothetical protein